MPQDAFTLRFIADELNDLLSGGKVSKINQLDKDEVIFIVYTKQGNKKVILSSNASSCRVAITGEERENPKNAPNFCMLLRKHLQNAQIQRVGLLDDERIIKITLLCKNEFVECERQLFVEIMGKYSNIVLVENGVILGALKSTSLEENYKRILFSGAKYSLPQKQDKVSPKDKKGIENLLDNFMGGDFAKYLFENVFGLSYPTALVIEEKFGLSLTADDFEKFYFSAAARPCVRVSGGTNEFFAVAPEKGELVFFDSVLEAQDSYYAKKDGEKKFSEKKKKCESAVKNSLKKAEKRLSQILSKKQECDNMEDNRIKGELITANLYAIKRGQKWCEVINYYDENCPTMKIELDNTLSPSQNAQKFYKKYNKQKRTITALEPQEREIREEIDYLHAIGTSISRADKVIDFVEIEEELKDLGLIKAEQTTKKKTPVTSAYREYEVEGYRIICGRNNLQNDRLLKECSPTDTWLHAQKAHSAHVYIKGTGYSENVLLAAAEICAFYSDFSMGSKVPVDYCEKKFVKKPPKSKAGFVIYTDYKTILVDPSAHENIAK